MDSGGKGPVKVLRGAEVTTLASAAPRMWIANKIAEGLAIRGVFVNRNHVLKDIDEAWINRVRSDAGGLLTVAHPALLAAIYQEIHRRVMGVVVSVGLGQ